MKKLIENYIDDKLEDIIRVCDDWLIEFLNSEHAKLLTTEQLWESMYLIPSFVESMYKYYNLIPGKWNEEALENFCLFILPAKASADESFFKAITPVLFKFFAFLDDRNVLQNTLELMLKIRDIEEEIVENGTNPKFWEENKSIAAEAVEEGVNLSDNSELDSFLNYKVFQRNQKVLHEMFESTNAMIQGDGSCICGSGKSYKECCGLVKERIFDL